MDEIISREEYEEIREIVNREKLKHKLCFLDSEFFERYELMIEVVDRKFKKSSWNSWRIGSFTSDSLICRSNLKNKFFKNVILSLSAGNLFLYERD